MLSFSAFLFAIIVDTVNLLTAIRACIPCRCFECNNSPVDNTGRLNKAVSQLKSVKCKILSEKLLCYWLNYFEQLHNVKAGRVFNSAYSALPKNQKDLVRFWYHRFENLHIKDSDQSTLMEQCLIIQISSANAVSVFIFRFLPIKLSTTYTTICICKVQLYQACSEAQQCATDSKERSAER